MFELREFVAHANVEVVIILKYLDNKERNHREYQNATKHKEHCYNVLTLGSARKITVSNSTYKSENPVNCQYILLFVVIGPYVRVSFTPRLARISHEFVSSNEEPQNNVKMDPEYDYECNSRRYLDLSSGNSVIR